MSQQDISNIPATIAIMPRKRIAGKYFLKAMVFSFGILLVFPSGCKLYNYLRIKNQGYETVGYVTKPGTGNYIGARPFVGFEDRDDNHHVVRSKVNYHFFFAPKTGDTFSVYYYEAAPEEALVDSPFHYFYLPIFFIAVGGYLLFCAFKKKME